MQCNTNLEPFGNAKMEGLPRSCRTCIIASMTTILELSNQLGDFLATISRLPVDNKPSEAGQHFGETTGACHVRRSSRVPGSTLADGFRTSLVYAILLAARNSVYSSSLAPSVAQVLTSTLAPAVVHTPAPAPIVVHGPAPASAPAQAIIPSAAN